MAKRAVNELLQKARLSRNWTQQQLGEKIGADRQTVGSWEQGKRFPSLEMRGRLIDVFSMPAEQLGLTESEEDAPTQALQTTVQQVHSLLSSSWTKPGISLYHIRKYLLHQIEVDENRHRMLKRVRTIWIEGVLRDSLSTVFLALGLEEMPNANVYV